MRTGGNGPFAGFTARTSRLIVRVLTIVTYR
jgi:hypothetical protein